MVQKPASRAVGSEGSFLLAAYRTKRAFRTQHQPPPRVLASQGTHHAKPCKDVCSIALRVLAAKFEGCR